MKYLLSTLAVALCGVFAMQATDFDTLFADSTLRVTYTFAASPQSGAAIYFNNFEATPHWAGRRAHLAELPLLGNGQIYMTDALSGDTIYATSFTTLFHEWLVTEEGKTTPRSFEYSFLLPVPKKKANLNVQLIDKHQQPIAKATHTYDPMDILVKKWSGVAPQHRYTHKGGDPKNTIDVAILAEGYTADQVDLFYEDAQKVTDAILGHEPFKSYADRFNFVAVPVTSRDGELSHPNRNEWHDTAFDCHYSTLYSDRYMTSPSSVAAHKALRGIPYEHIILMCNTEQYGGGGFYNLITTASAHNLTMPQVMVHEFGHSFGGLADEYFYPNDELSDIYTPGVEPWERNITNLTNFDSKPFWKNSLKKNTPIPTPVEKADKYPVGVYEGGGYIGKGMYRPADKCRMRVNDYPDFCPVCTDALISLFNFYTR